MATTCRHGLDPFRCVACEAAKSDHVSVSVTAVTPDANLNESASVNTKDTNPKDAIASDRVPLGLCPDTARLAAAMAFLEGALKYGRYNWRVAGVRASIYRDAFDRHTSAWWNGEDIDPKSKLPHLWKALACIVILIDAQSVNKLQDDRPPRAPVGDMLEDLMKNVAWLRNELKDHKPKQYTIADSPAA